MKKSRDKAKTRKAGIKLQSLKLFKKLMRLKKRNKLIRLLKRKNSETSSALELNKGLTDTPLLPLDETLPTRNRVRMSHKDLLFNLNFLSLNYLNVVRFNILALLFNGFFNRPLILECIRLHHSDAEGNILAQLLVLILKKKNIRSVINRLFNKNKVKDINFMSLQQSSNKLPTLSSINNQKLSDYIPVFISGLYIHINGRLMREPIIPRLTTKKFEKGAIATGKVSSLDKTQITKKNRKGSFTLNITLAQNII